MDGQMPRVHNLTALMLFRTDSLVSDVSSSSASSSQISAQVQVEVVYLSKMLCALFQTVAVADNIRLTSAQSGFSATRRWWLRRHLR